MLQMLVSNHSKEMIRLSDLVPDIMAKPPNCAGTVEIMLPPGAITGRK